MSIETMTAKAGPFDCDGVQTEFPFAFDPLDSSYLTVYVNSDIVSSGYSTTLNASGGTVTFATPPSSGARVAILRNVPPTQLVDLQNNTAFLPEVIEGMGDKLTAIAQQIMEVEERAFVIPPTADGTAKDEIERMISSGGGGGGGGGGSSYEFSNEFNVTSGGSVSVNKIDKNKITGLSSALDDKQDKLVSGGSYNINVDSAAVAGGFAYAGPFAVVTYSDGSGTVTAGCGSGYVYANGSHILVSGFGSDETAFNEGDTLYLTLSSGGGSISSGLVTSPTGLSSDTVLVRLAHNSGGVAQQIQFGDITTIPWGLGGSGTASAFVQSVGLGFVTSNAGIVFANATIDNSEAAGNEARLVIDGSSFVYAKVPQGGAESDLGSAVSIGCSLVRPVNSGVSVGSAGSMKQTIYFLGFSGS